VIRDRRLLGMVVALVAVDCALLALWHVIDPLRLQLSIYGHAVRSRIQVCAVIKQNLFRQFPFLYYSRLFDDKGTPDDKDDDDNDVAYD